MSSPYRCLPVVVVAVVGGALSVYLSGVAGHWERSRMEAHFSRAAEDRVGALRRSLESCLHEIEALGAFFDGSRQVERHEFRTFVKPFLAHDPGIQALEWIPRVPDTQRAEYEEAARAEGFPDFQITERETQGQMVRAERREEYFPVYFVEPYKGNEIALGFDLASNPTRLEALEASGDTGTIRATARIILVQETAQQFGFLIYRPIYRKGVPTDSLEDRRENLAGFALGVFRIGDTLRKAMAYLETQGIDFYLFDESAQEETEFLGFYSPRTSELSVEAIEDKEDVPKAPLRHIQTFDVAGRKWTLICVPRAEFLASRITWAPRGVLGAGLLLTGILTAYISLTLRRIVQTRRFAQEILQSTQHLEQEIAERKRAEEELQRSAEHLAKLNVELERSNRDLEEFTHTVSHDLQEPLRKIHTFGQFLMEDFREQLPEKARDYAQRMQEAAVRMQDLIQHLLGLARVGTRGGKPVEVAPSPVIERVLDTLSEQVRECGAEITVQEPLPTVLADPVQLGQVFQNLIGNALKFRSLDRAPKVTISVHVEGDQATFSVGDNGIGIEKRFLEKIFGVFQRLHPREQYEGKGVGLALCRRIIHRHGGRIWAESETGKGSTFRFTLPTRPSGKEGGCEDSGR